MTDHLRLVGCSASAFVMFNITYHRCRHQEPLVNVARSSRVQFLLTRNSQLKLVEESTRMVAFKLNLIFGPPFRVLSRSYYHSGHLWFVLKERLYCLNYHKAAHFKRSLFPTKQISHCTYLFLDCNLNGH